MKRYFTQPRARWCEEIAAETVDIAQAKTLFKPEPITRHTIIFTESGEPIMVSEYMGPIGTHFDDYSGRETQEAAVRPLGVSND